MSTSNEPRPRALITGASSGIGAAFAQRLAHDGHDLVLVARRGDRLARVADKLQAQEDVHVDIIVADLASSEGLERVEKRAAEDENLALLVNNAGFGAYMPFFNLPAKRAEELIRVQVIAVTRLTHAALPGMIARGHGAIINVSSRLGFSRSLSSPPLPKRAVYAATKAFVNTFSQILQNELEGTGVRVQALCPGVVETEFHEVMGNKLVSRPGMYIMRPEEVVHASLEGLRLKETICVPALEDVQLLSQIEERERQMLEHSGGDLAQRYRPAP